MQNVDHNGYFLPSPSHWPVVGCAGLFMLFCGAANWLHYAWFGPYLFFLGLLVIGLMFCGWFGTVIHENRRGLYSENVDRSFRWGMTWFIFSEVLFFACFFGALFFTRLWVVPELGGAVHPITHVLLWPDFTAEWPLFRNPDNHQYTAPLSLGNTWGIPALNTLLLLSSGVTITVAHHGLLAQNRRRLVLGLAATIALGITFLGCQANEYYQAYSLHGLTLNSGAYGSLFFILTGFHGAHVTIGTTMLIVILGRSLLGHFSPDNHFGFVAAAWYWHFVDVVWLLLFVFVYWL